MCGTAQPGTAEFSHVLCREDHSWKAISVLDLADEGRDGKTGGYPGEAVVRNAGQTACADAAREIADGRPRLRVGLRVAHQGPVAGRPDLRPVLGAGSRLTLPGGGRSHAATVTGHAHTPAHHRRVARRRDGLVLQHRRHTRARYRGGDRLDTRRRSPTGSPVQPTILFQRNGTQRTHIARVGLDGSGEAGTLPDFGHRHQTNPDWSPDGLSYVFAMVDGTTDDLFVAETGASDARKLLDCVSPCLYLTTRPGHRTGTVSSTAAPVQRDNAAVSTLETVEVATAEDRACCWARRAAVHRRSPLVPRTSTGSSSSWSTAARRRSRTPRLVHVALTALLLALGDTGRCSALTRRPA